jgi:hypothetical protein
VNAAERLQVVERRLRELGPVLRSELGPGQCVGIGTELEQLAAIVSRVRDLLAITVDAVLELPAGEPASSAPVLTDAPAKGRR